MKKILLTICLLFSLPPVTAQEVPLYENIQDNVPKLGVMNEVYLGDRMLEQRTGEYRECIIPKITLEKTGSSNLKLSFFIITQSLFLFFQTFPVNSPISIASNIFE